MFWRGTHLSGEEKWKKREPKWIDNEANSLYIAWSDQTPLQSPSGVKHTHKMFWSHNYERFANSDTRLEARELTTVGHG
jgi:hypothetical protein